LAEADLAANRALRIALRRRGARIRLGRSIPEALRIADEQAPDLVLVDCALGDMPPEALAERFRSVRPGVELIFLDSRPSYTPQGIGLGLLYSGMMPVAPETLLDIIDQAFPGRLGHAAAEKARPGKVLFVDDDPVYLRALSRAIARHGYGVMSCEDSKRALELLREARPDVAILDIMMPGMDGLDLAQRIREQSGGRVPVVFLTALDSKEIGALGHQRGASFFLTKPVETGKVLDVVDYIAGDLDEEERVLLKSTM
jgi:DNA-binding response OmpR family regulator